MFLKCILLQVAKNPNSLKIEYTNIYLLISIKEQLFFPLLGSGNWQNNNVCFCFTIFSQDRFGEVHNFVTITDTIEMVIRIYAPKDMMVNSADQGLYWMTSLSFYCCNKTP